MRKTHYAAKIPQYLFWALCLLAVFVALLTLRNSTKIISYLEKSTTQYVSDVATQMAEQVDFRIESSLDTLQIIGDSAVLLPEENLAEFLERKGGLSHFSSLHLATTQEAQQILEAAEQDSEVDIQFVHNSDATLLYTPSQQTLTYLLPLNDSTIIVGTKTSQNMQDFLVSSCFEGYSFSALLTRDSTVISNPSGTALIDQLFSPDDPALEAEVAQLRQDIASGSSGDYAFTSSDGEKMLVHYQPLENLDWILMTLVPADLISKEVTQISVRNQLVSLVMFLLLICVTAAITIQQNRYRHTLEKFAFTDPVTGGINTARFSLLASERLAELQDYALISADIQDFKLINNIYGTAAGDDTLRYIYQTMQESLTDSQELVTRASADLFYLLLHTRSEEELQNRLDALYHQINQFNQRLGSHYYLEIRFGVYIADPGETNIADMMEKANIARKNQSENPHDRCMFYSAIRQQAYIQEKELLNILDSSLANGDFKIYLQPKVRLRNQKIAGAEALIRWEHPEKGMLPPAQFIPVFEKHGLISKLDLFVFEEVCRLLARWNREKRELLVISVNLSRQNLRIPNFLHRYHDIYSSYGLPPGLIEFELTESIFIEEPSIVKPMIDEMHELSFQCSLDDFGTGYSSLGLLNDLNIDTIKLDRTFFIGKNNNQRGRCIVDSIMKLAGQLHISTVAEGIDSVEQVRFLNQSACSMIQGYIYSLPLPVAEFEAFAYNGLLLRHVPPADSSMPPQSGKSTTVESTAPTLNYIVSFSYDVPSDKAVFSAPFSPFLEDNYASVSGRELFGRAGLVHANDFAALEDMVRRSLQTDGWIVENLRFYASRGRYEWLEVYMHRDSPRTPDGPFQSVSGFLLNTEEWKAEVFRWKEKANRDALTGLYNRQALEELVNSLLQKRKRAHSAMIFIDIDDFKRINDTLGHICGDDVLRCIARRLTKVFRSTDVVARYGGDEFVVFAPGIERSVLVQKLEQLLDIFHEEYTSGSIHYHFSGSIGVSCYPDHASTFQDLISTSDSALYEAKRLGKNQYVIYQPPASAADEAPTA